MEHILQKSALKDLFTYEDYKHLPNDGKRYEIIEGELLISPSPKTGHQRIHARLFNALMNFVQKNHSGELFSAPLDVVFSNLNVVQPDLLFISKKRRSIIAEDNIRGAPDLIVEILSPYTEKADRIQKKELYAVYGVREYWIADPEKETIEVYSLSAEGYRLSGTFEKTDRLQSVILKGFEINLFN
ncbi:hypothetical protein BMS3Abin05_00322 [bacterium BMS3Abin05]|nr:hypothetical protein BMS3Abin05_00322 [bacterium BMS3Abin05]GBE28183.1 hypothetical protein BMS3Bbin03_02122 [bacterium BMS3Bbin03]